MNIIRPIITEKSMSLASVGWYTFLVDKQANKNVLAKQIEEMYHVNVQTIRTIAQHGKVRRTGKKMITTRKPDTKKAMVLVKKGQKIDAFEVTTQETKEPEKKAGI